MSEIKRPLVGVGVLLFNEKNQVLLGIRKSRLGQGRWGIPGGHLEFGETFEDCAIRELFEETGVLIKESLFLAVTNNLFEDTKTHYVSIFMRAFLPEHQYVQNKEPDKVVSWQWFDWDALPENLLIPMQTLLKNKQFMQIHDIISLKKSSFYSL